MTPAAPEALYRQAVSLLACQRPADTVCALMLLQQAASQGHPQAAAELAQRLSGEEAPSTRPDADTTYALLQHKTQNGICFEHLLRDYAWLAENGHPTAQLQLLNHYAAQNSPQALYWAELAAAHHQAEGHLFLAQHHHYATPPDWPRAVNHYRHAAELGSHEAHWQLGQIHSNGYGGLLDTQAAEHHLHAAAQGGIRAALTRLAQLLAAQNRPEALIHYQTAAASGDLQAHSELAEHLLTGRLCARDPLNAARYAKAAAEAGYPEALRQMGDLYRYGLGVKADAHTAAEYYHQAAEAGCISAYQKLLSDAALYHSEHYHNIKAAALARQTAEQHYRRAHALHHALNGHTNLAAARKHYLAAAEQHHPEACAALGGLYKHGQGVRRCPQQAAYWYSLAAEQGHADAQHHLADLYYLGHGTAHNIVLACHWLQAAIENGSGNPIELAAKLAVWQQEYTTT